MKNFLASNLFNKPTSRLTIIAVVVIFALCAPQLLKVQFDYKFESFFPQNDKDLVQYQNFIEAFGTDNDFLIVGIKNENGILNQHFLSEVDSLSTALKNLNYVNHVNSPTRISYPIKSPIGYSNVKYLHINRPDFYQSDSLRITKTQNLIGGLISKDFKSISIFIEHESNLTKKQNDSLVVAIENLVQSFPFQESHIAGKIKGQYYFISKMGKELFLFILVSIVLVIMFLYITFKNLWGIWVPLVVVGFTILFLFSLMGFMGKKINIMTTVLPTILFVVGISNVVHILEKYIEELRKGVEKFKALGTAFREIGIATFLTCFTTAIGFLSLSTSNILPVKEFGFLTAIGVLIAFILAFTLLPSVLALVGIPRIVQRELHNLFWARKLHYLYSWLIHQRKQVLFAFVIIGSFSVWAATKLEVDNKFADEYLVSERDKIDYQFFENQFSGFRPFEVDISVKDTSESILQLNVLQELEVLDSLIRNVYNTDYIFSILSFVKGANQAIHGGNVAFYTLPKDQENWAKIQQERRKFKIKKSDNFLTKNEKRARFSCKIPDTGGKDIKKKNELLARLFSEIQPNASINYQLTGMPLLIDKNNEYLARNVSLGLILAFSIIAIIMGLLFKSWRIILISIIPNMLPLIWIAAIMSIFDINLKISTSIIFTIAFGIAVDDTIHFMSKFRLELAKGKSIFYALKRTYISTGKAILITTFILCAGFMVLLLSSVPSTFYIGLLVSLTLAFALIADLLLLPVLIMFFYKNHK